MNSQSSLPISTFSKSQLHISHKLDDHRNQASLSMKNSNNDDSQISLDSIPFTSLEEVQGEFCSTGEPIFNLHQQIPSHYNPGTYGESYALNRSKSHGYQTTNYYRTLENNNTTLSAHHKPSHSRTESLLKFALPFGKSKLDEVTGSKVDRGCDAREDVCFPVPNKKKWGIDFSELRRFEQIDKEFDQNSRNYYRPAISYAATSHRPLVPHAIIRDPTKECPVQDHHAGSSKSSLTEVETSNGMNEKKYSSTSVSSTFNNWTETYDNNRDIEFDPKSYFGNARRNSFTMDRFSFFAADIEDTIHAPDMSSLLSGNASFEDLFTSSNGIWWLDCLDPTDTEINAISKAFGIHPLTVEDITSQETREKVELFKKYYFVCFHTFEPDTESEIFLDPIYIYLIVFREGVISFHFSPIQHAPNVRRRIRQLRDYVRVSSDWICYAIIDDITDGFIPIIRDIEVETDVIEDFVFVAREADFGPMIRRIGEARQKVMILLRLLSGKADVIKMFAKRCTEHWDNAPESEIGLYLGDIQDHIITMHQNLSVYEKIFSRSHANYLAQLQVESVNSNNRVTKVLGRVTLIGTILVPLNLVTGLFGMNVRVPGQGGDDLKWFFGIIGFIVAIVIMFSLIANKWLGEAESDGDSPPAALDSRLPKSRNARRISGAKLFRTGSR